MIWSSVHIFPATGLCFGERNIYTAEVLAFVLQQLMEQPTLPTLFMRTVIQTLTHYPKLLGFIMNVLQRLISRQVGIKFVSKACCSKVYFITIILVVLKIENILSFECIPQPYDHVSCHSYKSCYILQVWKQRKVWEGFIKCCQRAGAQSFTVLLQLPPPQLADVFSVAPDLRSRLLAHIATLTENQVNSSIFFFCLYIFTFYLWGDSGWPLVEFLACRNGNPETYIKVSSKIHWWRQPIWCFDEPYQLALGKMLKKMKFNSGKQHEFVCH